MVLAELAGGVALVLERGGDGDDLLVHADWRAGDADLREAGAIDALPGDEGGAARGAGLLAVGVGEHHAFLGEAVDVGRLVAHQAMRIAAQVAIPMSSPQMTRMFGFAGLFGLSDLLASWALFLSLNRTSMDVRIPAR